MMKLEKIIGLKVVAIRGHRPERKNSRRGIEPEYILFDDGETYICLVEQDPYDYHDCSFRAREIEIYSSARRWEQIIHDREFYPESTKDICF